ncbi:MAG: hypothetical protein P8Y43_02505 [Sulfurovaceae bacterium]
MKKALLLSVIASTMIMAGGDIAPVEPVVEVEAPAPSGWTFTGQGVVYYQSADELGAGVDARSLTDQDSSSANAGVSLKAENKDIIGGLGAGVKLVGVGTLGLEEDVVSNVMQTADGTLNGGAITELYLTYGIGNTLIKVGRQELPKALSPLAFSESWNVFANTFEAALVVNSDIPNTTLVGAWVRSANSHRDLGDFNEGAGIEVLGDDGAYMLTAAYADAFNVTGTAYYLPDVANSGEDLMALWVDAGFNVSDFNIGVQGGYYTSDAFVGHEDTYAVGAKFGAKFDPVTVGAALTWVNDGGIGITNLVNPYGLGEVNGVFGENALYTCSPLGSNALFNFVDATTVSLNGSMALPVGTLIAFADYSDIGDHAWVSNSKFYEGAIAYNVVLGDLDLTAGVVHQNIDPDTHDDMTNTLIRVVARYNF